MPNLFQMMDSAAMYWMDGSVLLQGGHDFLVTNSSVLWVLKGSTGTDALISHRRRSET